MREYRCALTVTDAQGQVWEMEHTFVRWQAGGELADRKDLMEQFAEACARGMQRHGIFFGAIIGHITVDLIAQRQPGWDELAAIPTRTAPELKLVKGGSTG